MKVLVYPDLVRAYVKIIGSRKYDIDPIRRLPVVGRLMFSRSFISFLL